MTTSGPGIQRDNVEASASADATITNLKLWGARTFSGSGLTAALQDWGNGQPNNGWVLWQDSTNAWRVRTSDDATLSNRPLLTVTYRPPVAATTMTGAGVTVAVLDSGLLQDGGGTGRILTTRDFTGGSSKPAAVAALDPYGHGTHVAGLIGGARRRSRAWRRA
jgi:subtilisin family serine protease